MRRRQRVDIRRVLIHSKVELKCCYGHCVQCEVLTSHDFWPCQLGLKFLQLSQALSCFLSSIRQPLALASLLTWTKDKRKGTILFIPGLNTLSQRQSITPVWSYNWRSVSFINPRSSCRSAMATAAPGGRPPNTQVHRTPGQQFNHPPGIPRGITKLGDYRIVKTLGEGSFGKVRRFNRYLGQC